MSTPGAPEQLAHIRDETRFEIGLLHERVNALVTAEAFLTIAFTTAMGNGAPWGATFSVIVSPVLSVLGLLLALLAWPGVNATVKIVLHWTTSRRELLEREPELAASVGGSTAPGRKGRGPDRDQRRSMLFFRAVPGLFTVVWVLLTVVALALHRTPQ